MRIVVVGAGGVGGYFGGKLARAGFDVTFIARGKHLETISKSGLQIKSINGDFKVYPKVTDNILSIPKNPVLILLAVKSWQVVDVANQIKPIVGKNTLVLPLQNGADNADKLLSVLPKENVLAGLCRIVSKIESPGVINHFDFDPEIIFGELNNEKSARIKNLKATFDKADFRNKISEDIFVDIWIKLLLIITYSGIGALTRMPIGAIRTEPFLKQMMINTANEVLQIAQAKNILLTKLHVEMILRAIENLDYNSTTSMQRDVMEGKPSELDNFNGYIFRQGLELGIKTPVNDFIYYCLLPQEKKARKLI